MPPLLKSADIKPDVNVEDGEEGDDDEEEGIATVFVQTDDGGSHKKVAIKTSALEEKSTACNMLVCYFSELQEGMFPYIETVAKIMVPLLSFLFSEEVRTAAAALMPELAKAAVNSMRSGLCDLGYVNNMLSFMFEKLISSIIEEPEPEVQSAMIEVMLLIFDHFFVGQSIRLACFLALFLFLSISLSFFLSLLQKNPIRNCFAHAKAS